MSVFWKGAVLKGTVELGRLRQTVEELTRRHLLSDPRDATSAIRASGAQRVPRGKWQRKKRAVSYFSSSSYDDDYYYVITLNR